MTPTMCNRAIALALGLLCSGCAASHMFEPETLALSRLQGSGLCEEVNSARPSIAAFRSLAESTVTSGRQSISFRYVIVGREPDKMRIDLLPTEGAFTLGILVSDGEHIRVINSQEKTYQESTNKAALLEEFLGIRGASPSLVQALVTGVPPQFDCDAVTVYEEPNGSRVVVDTRDRVAWTIRRDTGKLTGFHVLSPDDDSAVAEGALYYAGGKSPSSMSLSVFEPHEAHAVLLFKKIILDPIIADEVFAVEIPASYAREE